MRLAGGELLVLRAEGHSMWPRLRDGAHVVVRPLPPTGPQCGDIALATIGGRAVLHRVVGVRRDVVLLKGDANPRPDGWIPQAQLVGRVEPEFAGALVAVASRFGGAPLARALGWLRRRRA